jgi:hypothetical protein
MKSPKFYRFAIGICLAAVFFVFCTTDINFISNVTAAQQQQVVKAKDVKKPKGMSKEIFAPTIKVTWKQNEADRSSLDKFLIWSGKNQTDIVQIKEIPYTGQQDLLATIKMPVTGTPGEVVPYYFAIQAVSKNGNLANKVFGKTIDGKDFISITIPYNDVGDSYEVIIQIITE